MGAAPWQPPLPKKIMYFASYIYIISGPFWSKFTEIYDFWWSKGGSPSLYVYTIFGVAKGQGPLPKKILYFVS